ncbi:serine/threonine protein kinase [Paenibacillus sp. S-38]|uniref:serine/threonine protein kinase n=1 Tax=Paenibacillus sp. S-38 TaxID=3416710 RepID=UPI003CFABBE5
MADGTVRYEIDEVTFELREAHDFGWLRELGQVFAVFDRQDSGNISFGVLRDGEKLFIKYAGAKPVCFSGEACEAVTRLRAATVLYQKLAHPYLVKWMGEIELPFGYAAVFQWQEGTGLRGAEAMGRFKGLPLGDRLAALGRIFEFHAHVEEKGYAAVDFYDGSLLYDYAGGGLTICDIDVYQQVPFVNPVGRLWGSSRFMSPEEYVLGAEIDGCTNVFTMGAMAFALAGGGGGDRSPALWEAGEARYAVALRAVQADRSLRYPAVSAFKAAWDTAGGDGTIDLEEG